MRLNALENPDRPHNRGAFGGRPGAHRSHNGRDLKFQYARPKARIGGDRFFPCSPGGRRHLFSTPASCLGVTLAAVTGLTLRVGGSGHFNFFVAPEPGSNTRDESAYRDPVCLVRQLPHATHGGEVDEQARANYWQGVACGYS